MSKAKLYGQFRVHHFEGILPKPTLSPTSAFEPRNGCGASSPTKPTPRCIQGGFHERCFTAQSSSLCLCAKCMGVERTSLPTVMS